MPLAGPLFGTTIFAQFSAKGFTGSKALTLANAIGIGSITNIQATNFYDGTATGIGTGAGKGTGFVQGIVGTVAGALIYKEMLSQNLTGSKALDLANAVGSAFATHIKLGIINSVASPVANGTGIGKIKGVTGVAMGNMILATMVGFGLTGSKNRNLATAIGNGLASSISQGIAQTVITGGGYPPVSVSGKDFGKLI